MITANDAMVAAAELEEAKLSPGERDVLILTAKGLLAREVGELLGTSHKTVHAHLNHIHRKLDMTTIEAVVLAVKAGWV